MGTQKNHLNESVLLSTKTQVESNRYEIIIILSSNTNLDTQKNHLNEMVLLSTQNTLKVMDMKIFTILSSNTKRVL